MKPITKHESLTEDNNFTLFPTYWAKWSKERTQADLSRLVEDEKAACKYLKKCLKCLPTQLERTRLVEFWCDHSHFLSNLSHMSGVDWSKTLPLFQNSMQHYWKTFFYVVHRSSKLFGNLKALEVLREAEQNMLSQYQALLQTLDLDSIEFKKIQEFFIPRLQWHIQLTQSMARM